MPTRDEWLALAERCERAEGPGRGLDRDFGVVLHPEANLWTPSFWSGGPDEFLRWPDREDGSAVYERLPEYTASLDAAVAVVEARFGKEWALGHSGTLCFAAITNFPKRLEGSSYFNDALALMAAYCRARAEEAEK